MVELLAPAGNFESLAAALEAGADAVYFGSTALNMRSLGSTNFTIEELRTVVDRCHEKNTKAYLTLNSIIYENEYKLLEKTLKAAKKAEVDAVIAWDLAVLQRAKELGIQSHLSTQASVSNFNALRFYYEFGVRRFVLARELDLKQIKKIIAEINEQKMDAEIETFVHGAMCIAVSGRCFMSQAAHCKSANRGECLQVCRRKFKITDLDEGTDLVLENQYVMSPKDICTMPIFDKILESGIEVLKIEGRARSPEYVKTVVASYRKAIDEFEKGNLTDELKKELIKKMEKVYNRGFEIGFYMGKPMDAWAGCYGSNATTRKVYLGKISHYYTNAKISEVKIESGEIKKGDKFYIIGPTTGVLEGEMTDFMVDDKFVTVAQKGEIFTFKSDKSRTSDKFYRIETKISEYNQMEI